MCLPSSRTSTAATGGRRRNWQRSMPVKAAREVWKRAPAFSYCGTRYHWAGPDLVREVLDGDMPEVLERMDYGHLAIDDFQSQTELLRFLKERYGVGSPGSLRTAERKGTVLRVQATRPGNGGVYDWVPPQVRTGSDPRVVRDWFAGKLPPPANGWAGTAALRPPRYGGTY
jgi:hypothetical protein